MKSSNWVANTFRITDEEFAIMRTLIHNRLGINLTEQKRGLLVTRLKKYMQQTGFADFKQYAEHIHNDKTGKALGNLADLISTNHTFFFRESGHFDFLSETALPQITEILKAQNSKDLRMWCAAASTGEEPYGLMLMLMEYLGPAYASWNAGLLATDISNEALMRAEEGIYEDESVARIPLKLRNRYFHKTRDGLWGVNDSLKKEIIYRRFNLVQSQFPFKKPFHIIFCRNVMIYFDQWTIQDLINRLYDWTVPGGYLFVGFSESLGRIENPYQFVKPAIYRKSG